VRGGLSLAMLSVVTDAVTTPYEAIRRSQLGPSDVAVFVGVGGVGGFGELLRYLRVTRALSPGGEGYQQLSEYIKEQSIGEIKHAEAVMERILFLDDSPSMQPLELTVGKNVQEMLQSSLNLELGAVIKELGNRLTSRCKWERTKRKSLPRRRPLKGWARVPARHSSVDPNRQCDAAFSNNFVLEQPRRRAILRSGAFAQAHDAVC
jgi:Ferritin-like domain